MKKEEFETLPDAIKAIKELQHRIGGSFITPKNNGNPWLNRPYLAMHKLDIKYVIHWYRTKTGFYIKPEKI